MTAADPFDRHLNRHNCSERSKSSVYLPLLLMKKVIFTLKRALKMAELRLDYNSYIFEKYILELFMNGQGGEALYISFTIHPPPKCDIVNDSC